MIHASSSSSGSEDDKSRRHPSRRSNDKSSKRRRQSSSSNRRLGSKSPRASRRPRKRDQDSSDDNISKDHRSKRKQRIHFVINAILKEQKTKRSLDDQWIEQFNKIYTSKSAQAAYNKGIWDATEANRDDTVRSNPEVWI